jgi:hypothetical protein
VEKDRTCSELITLILKRGGRWKNKEIERAIIDQYGVQYQNNTIAKYLSFLIKKGKALSAPTGGGAECFEYWWVAEGSKVNHAKRFPLPAHRTVEKCIEAAKTYPEDHPQLAEITN